MFIAPQKKDSVADQRNVLSPDHRNSRHRSRTSGASQSQRTFLILQCYSIV